MPAKARRLQTLNRLLIGEFDQLHYLNDKIRMSETVNEVKVFAADFTECLATIVFLMALFLEVLGKQSEFPSLAEFVVTLMLERPKLAIAHEKIDNYVQALVEKKIVTDDNFVRDLGQLLKGLVRWN